MGTPGTWVLREWQGRLLPQTPSHVRGERSMDKWRILKNNMIVRYATSASTLVAVAVLVGAGNKWN